MGEDVNTIIISTGSAWLLAGAYVLGSAVAGFVSAVIQVRAKYRAREREQETR